MDTAWTWDLSSYCAKYSFLTDSKGLTMAGSGTHLSACPGTACP